MFQPASQRPEQLDDPLYLVFQRGRIVSDMRSAEGPLLNAYHIQDEGWQAVDEVFLGYWQGRACLALSLDSCVELDAMRYHLGSLYQILGRVSEPVFTLAGRAAQLLHWLRDHQFCGRCGQAMTTRCGEHARVCEPCDLQVYPRIAPCVIVLVTRGEELLLARSANYPGDMYSTLAGFIEAGESAEETLVREVREEVGVEIDNIRYFRSQSWPFPSQLMLGYFAYYAGGDIVCDPTEIADARWYHYRDLPHVPPAYSVAGQLIGHYIQQLNQ